MRRRRGLGEVTSTAAGSRRRPRPAPEPVRAARPRAGAPPPSLRFSSEAASHPELGRATGTPGLPTKARPDSSEHPPLGTMQPPFPVARVYLEDQVSARK